MNVNDTIVLFKTKSAVNIRKSYSANSEILLALDKDEKLIIKDSIGNWLSVAVPSKNLNGFINKNYVLRDVQFSKTREFDLKSLNEETIYSSAALFILMLSLLIFFRNKIKKLKNEHKNTLLENQREKKLIEDDRSPR